MLIYYCNYAYYCLFCFLGWLKSVGSRVVYKLDYKKPILYVIPFQSIMGKLPVFSVGASDTGTIPHHLRNTFPGAPGDRRPGAGDGCKMWFINSWALGRSRDMNLKGLQRATMQGERLHVTSMLNPVSVAFQPSIPLL